MDDLDSFELLFKIKNKTIQTGNLVPHINDQVHTFTQQFG